MVTLDNFYKETGSRFRMTQDQIRRVAAGEITRQQAFEEFIANGGQKPRKPKAVEIPISVYLDESLTIDNFSDKVFAATGENRRFRINAAQRARGLTREQAFQEVVDQKRNSI